MCGSTTVWISRYASFAISGLTTLLHLFDPFRVFANREFWERARTSRDTIMRNFYAVYPIMPGS
jgi:hypothetical protein